MNTSCVNDNLVIYDIENFLEKYTRFMTKNIYVSRFMYDNFLRSYDYLYKILESDAILYRENPKYKKIMEIKNNRKKLLKLHNQKYLKKNLDKYNTFFDNIKLDNELDLNQKYVVLSNEDKMLYINNKNVESLIVAKIKYLVDISKIRKDKILVLVDEDKKIRSLLNSNELDDVNLFKVSSYRDEVIGDNIVITNEEKSKILGDYIIKDLFKDKSKFDKLCKVFSDNIYLNKDYKDFDTFSDYHNYMYKRMFLSSKLSLNRFVDKEINKKKKYLRTIKNELVSMIEEVEVGNYLCFNNIDYRYHYFEKKFYISDNNKQFKVKVINRDDNNYIKDNYDENTIYINLDLVKNNIYKEILDDEFNTRNIIKKEISYEDVYNILRGTIIDNYFGTFINKYLIRYLDYYEVNKCFDNTSLSLEQIEVIEDIYKYYDKYLKDNSFITNNEVMVLLENSINNKKYKYIIVNSDISLKLDSDELKIIDDYKEVELIKENIKLLYDYKRYLQDNKMLVAANLYVDNTEIDMLTNMFLKKNLSIINEYFINSKKKISIYLYDDSNRLKINKIIAKECYEIVRKSKDILIGINSVSDINSLVYRDYFVKMDKKKLFVNGIREIECEEILKIRKSYDKIILPFLIVDSYHEDLIDNNYDYKIKLTVYVSLSKCKSELVLLCPKMKRKEITKLFKKNENIVIFE